MSSDPEGRIQLAIQAIELDQIKSGRAAAAMYDAPPETLRQCRGGRCARRDLISPNRKLTLNEESAIVQYVLELDSRGFSPRPCEVREMADLLLAERDGEPTGKN
jgi:hypothetical protein